MSDLFDDKTREKLRTRATLDSIEAESEMDKKDGKRDMSVSFSEEARSSLEKFFSMTEDEMIEAIKNDAEKKDQKIRAFIATNPSELELRLRGSLKITRGRKVRENAVYWNTLLMSLGQEESIRLLTVNSAAYVRYQIEQNPHASTLYKNTISSLGVNCAEEKLSIEVIESATRLWLSEYYPELQDLPMNFSGLEHSEPTMLKMLSWMAGEVIRECSRSAMKKLLGNKLDKDDQE